jgi:periplasmic protein TonB
LPWLGAPISAAGHAAVIALAVWALPWLRAGPDPEVSVVAVRLVSPESAAPPPPVPASPDPAPPPSASTPSVVRPEATTPHDAAPAAAPPPRTFGGAFDPDAPLGIPALSTASPDSEEFDGAGRPAATPDVEDQGSDEAGDVLAYRDALQAAVERAKVYPQRARDRGLYGTTGVAATLGPGGALAGVRITRSSGAKALDDAALAAVRDARLPAPPESLAGTSLAYDLGISFTLRDN